MIIRTVTDLKRECDIQGYHWFDAEAVRYFKSRWRDKIYKDKYFISSEKFGFADQRLFTIRVFTIKRGKISISAVGEFQGYGSYKQAVKHIKDNL